MRVNPIKKYYTKPERILIRLLQESRIQFKTKQKILGREVDFLIGKLIIELDGHPQDVNKNNELVILGYTPIHFSNEEIYKNRRKVADKIIEIIK